MQSFLVEFESSVRAWIAALSERLRRTTPRERLLLGGLVLGALAYAPIGALEWRTNQEDRYIDAVTERAAAQLGRRAAVRVAAAAADDSAVEDMRTWGFEASNIAVAQVLIERRLVADAIDAGLTNPKVTLENEIEAVGPTQWLGAEVQADLSWKGVFGFLDDLTAWPEGFRITRFQYEMVKLAPGMVLPEGRPVGTVRMGLAFPVTVQDVEPSGSARGSRTAPLTSAASAPLPGMPL